MHMFLFSLGKFVSVPIVSEWIVLKDLVLFDTSCSSSKCRPILFEYYKDYPLQFQHDHVYLRLQLIQWTKIRQLIGFQSVSLVEKFVSVIESKDLKAISSTLVNVSFEYSGENSFKSILKGIQLFSRMKSLHLIGLQGSFDYLLMAVSGNCSSLTSIIVKQCKLQSFETLAILCKQNHQIAEIETDQDIDPMLLFKCLVVHCRNLEIVKMHSYNNSTALFLLHCSSSLSRFFGPHPLLLHYHAPHLKFLNIYRYHHEIRFNERCPQLSSLVLQDIAISYEVLKSFPTRLTSLSFACSYYSLNDAALNIIGNCCPSLEVLSSSQLEGSEYCFRKLPNLTALTIRGGSVSVLRSAAWFCKSLSKLRINGYASEEGFTELMKSCTKLNDLKMEHFTDSRLCDVLSENATRMVRLKLSTHLLQTNDKMKVLFSNCTHVTALHFHKARLDEELLQTLVTYCVRLRVLDITNTEVNLSLLKSYLSFMPQLLDIKTSFNEADQADLDRIIANT